MSGYTLAEDGYKGKKGTVLGNWKANETYMLTYALTYRLSGKAMPWATLRNLSAGSELGDIGKTLCDKAPLNTSTTNDDPRTIQALV